MKIKNGFILREVAGAYVVVAVGKRSKEFNGMVNSNATGAFLWKLLEKGADAKELAAQLAASYEVDMAQAAHDVEKFLKILQENNLMEESENP